jgi:hypothetical protein
MLLTKDHARTGIHHLTLAHKIFSQFAYQRDHTRAAIFIEIMMSLLRSSSTPLNILSLAAPLPLTSRYGASVVWTTMFLTSYSMNISPVTGTIPPPGGWISINERNALRLPGTPAEKAFVNETMGVGIGMSNTAGGVMGFDNVGLGSSSGTEDIAIGTGAGGLFAEAWEGYDQYIGEFGLMPADDGFSRVGSESSGSLG